MKERGIALISALVIVAVATASAMAMTLRAHNEMRRTQVLFNKDRAGNALRATYQGISQHLSAAQLEEIWQGRCQGAFTPMAFEDITLEVSLEDLRCRFNVNALSASEQNQERFSEWLNRIELNGKDITHALSNWMNPEADDRAYAQLQPPRSAGKRWFVQASEINQVIGITPEIWQRLAPFITAYPSDEAGFSGPNTPFAEEPRSALKVVAVKALARIDGERFYRCGLLDLSQQQWLFITHSACAN